MAQKWRNVWRVPDKQHAWRRSLEHHNGNDYLGSKTWISKVVAEREGRLDEDHFVGEMGMNVQYIGAVPTTTRSTELN